LYTKVLVYIYKLHDFLVIDNHIFASLAVTSDSKERGFNNARKYGAGFWLHRRVRKTGA